jgi:hypothetical protein
MEQPNIEGLLRVAVFQIGDMVYTLRGAKPWRVTARYWSPRQQCIVYDLLFEYNGTELPRMPEHELSATERSRYAGKY